MGKKSKRKGAGAGAGAKPFVSVCTPTFNRRPFFWATIKCYLHQDYPRDRMEWIIIDDGTDKIEDLVKDVPGVRYFSYDTKMPLGKKRNLMHLKSKGDIIVYQDDDDYYPVDRVSHAVQTLTNSTALAAGSSEIYIWFKHIQTMYQFGPYSPTHATAGTFAFKRKLIHESSYDEGACIAEERKFLKEYTVPFVQLDPMKTILVFSHEHNTFDKRRLLEGTPNPQYCKPSSKRVADFVAEADLKDFFINKINGMLDKYAPGLPSMKPDVLKQIVEIQKERDEAAKNNVQIAMTQPDGTSKTLTNAEILEVLENQNKEIETLRALAQNPTIIVEGHDGSKKQLQMSEFMQTAQECMVHNEQLLKEIALLRGTLDNYNPDITIDCAGRSRTVNLSQLVAEYQAMLTEKLNASPEVMDELFAPERDPVREFLEAAPTAAADSVRFVEAAPERDPVREFLESATTASDPVRSFLEAAPAPEPEADPDPEAEAEAEPEAEADVKPEAETAPESVE